MKRREFTLGAAAAALPGLLSQPAHAQSGKGYTELGRRAPVEAPPGQVEVVEFFPMVVGRLGRSPGESSFPDVGVMRRE